MAHTAISAGMSIKRPGAEQYSSDGYHLTVEMETDIENADHFQAAVSALFAEVKAALEAEVANGSAAPAETARVDLWGAGGNGGNGNGRKAARPAREAASKSPSSRSNENGCKTARNMKATADSAKDNGGNGEPVSNKQARYIVSLAAKQAMTKQADITAWLKDEFGHLGDVYSLTKRQASKVIEALRPVTSDTKGGRS